MDLEKDLKKFSDNMDKQSAIIYLLKLIYLELVKLNADKPQKETKRESKK